MEIKDQTKSLKRVKKEENWKKTNDRLSLNIGKMFGISLFSGNKDQVLKILEEKLTLGTKKYWIATVNPEFIMATFAKASATEKNERTDFYEILKTTDLNVMDGIGLIWAKALNEKYQETITKKQTNNLKIFLKKVLIGFGVGGQVLRGKYRDQVASGADLILDLAKMAKEKNKKIFLLGGWQDRAKKTAEYLSIKYQVSGIKYCVGEPEINNEEVLKQINKFKPDILLVAYGMKKQEEWIYQNLNRLEVGVVMGVGRSFDYYSGDLKRAPNWVRKMGMEWLYSLIKEPKRLKRQLELPKFVWKVLKD